MKLCLLLLAAGCLFRMPAKAGSLPLLGLARVSVRVSDLNQARAFYSGFGGFAEALDATNADGSLAAAYFKINDQQFLEIIPGLKSSDVRPMTGFAIRTGHLKQLRAKLATLGLKPGRIRAGLDGSTGFALTNLPGQDLGFLDFVQDGPGSVVQRTKGRDLGNHRLSTHLEHVGIIATNFDAAYDFYVKTLGFRETWRRVSHDRSRVILNHMVMPGPSGDFVELSNFGGLRGRLTRKRAGGAAHFALEVPDIKAVVPVAQSHEPRVRFVPPRYGLDNRWNFNVFDPDGTRMEFMQTVDPAHPAPAVVVTPAKPPKNQAPAK